MSTESIKARSPKWIVDGAPCSYRPVKSIEREFAGTIDGAPFVLGGHTTVVNVRLTDEARPAYAEWTGRPREVVHAVALTHLSRRAA